MSQVLIDTNIYSRAFRGDEDVVATLRGISDIGFSVISMGELLAGFKAGSREKGNIEELAEFLDSSRVVLYDVDDETTRFYAGVLDGLRRAGTPIPTNGIWIAAIAFRNGLTLYTGDAHFQHVAGLSLI